GPTAPGGTRGRRRCIAGRTSCRIRSETDRPARTDGAGTGSNREEEGCPRPLVRDGPQPPAMVLDDRPADREAHPHSTTLRGVERVEESADARGVESDT